MQERDDTKRGHQIVGVGCKLQGVNIPNADLDLIARSHLGHLRTSEVNHRVVDINAVNDVSTPVQVNCQQSGAAADIQDARCLGESQFVYPAKRNRTALLMNQTEEVSFF